ncbi:Hint module [Seminavis robusta]|uniref:Hint module n=1 Tax=Seminavis robusta TaxID=568900 RepID=A0A9N8HS72_9STRA|nr:Hint module [Seminavis robusta]|eukprot:Sro1140_g245540.1 Hint module (664) ;mRNA; r:20900-22992
MKLSFAILLFASGLNAVKGQSFVTASTNYCDAHVEQCLEVTESECSGSELTFCLQDKSGSSCDDGTGSCVCKSDSSNSETYSHINIYVDGIDLSAESSRLSDTGFADTCNDSSGSSKGCGLVDSSGTPAQGVKYESTKGGLCVTVPLASDGTHPKVVFGVKDRGSCGIYGSAGSWSCSTDCHCGGNHACVFETASSCSYSGPATTTDPPTEPPTDAPTATPTAFPTATPTTAPTATPTSSPVAGSTPTTSSPTSSPVAGSTPTTPAPTDGVSCSDYDAVNTNIFCYFIKCHYDGGFSTPSSVSFTKTSDSCTCPDWDYCRWGPNEEESVEGVVGRSDGEALVPVPRGAFGNTFEVHAGGTCFDVTCESDGSATATEKDTCGWCRGGGGGGWGNLHVEHKGDIQLKDLHVGDKVLTGKNKFETVYSFGHHHDDLVGDFLQIHTAQTEKPLEITENHLIFSLDGEGKEIAVPAGKLQVGDLVLSNGSTKEVTKITYTKKEGVYMPLTPSGKIEVDGIVASAYVSLREEAPSTIETTTNIFGMTEQALSHWWLAPYRMLCLGVSSSFCRETGSTNHSDDGILPWLGVGLQFAHFSESVGFWVRSVVIGVPTFLAFGFLAAIETLLGGPSVAPLGLLLAGVCAYYGYKKQMNEKTWRDVHPKKTKVA